MLWYHLGNYYLSQIIVDYTLLPLTVRLFIMRYASSNKKTFAKATLSASLALLMALALPFSAFATPADDKQAEADAAYVQLTEKQEFLDNASNNWVQAVADQEAAEAAVNEAQERIDAASKRISQLQELMSNRARTMYRSGSLTIIDLLFGATSFEEFANNWDLLTILNQNDADMISETKNLKAEIEEQKVVLVEQQEIATQKAKEAEEIKNEAESVVAEMQSIYDNLSAEAAELLEQEQAAREAAALEEWNNNNSSNNDGDSDNGGSSSSTDDSYSGRADAGSVVGRAYALLNEGDNYYVWGGVGPKGFDCSGFVSYCLTGNYSRLGTTYTFLGYTEVSDPQPGDIAVNSGHCGIYIGGGQMIHAASPGQGIVIGSVQSGMTFHRW